MKSKEICIIILLLLSAVPVLSQTDSTFKDSLKEITIYEYDTIYLQPDTIRLTDTVIKTVKINPSKTPVKKNENKSFFASLIPNSLSISLGSYFAGKFSQEMISDTLSIQKLINYNAGVGLNYYTKKFVLAIELSYSPVHERHKIQKTFPTAESNDWQSGIYDSFVINKQYTYNYYINYFDLNLLFGRRWKINNKWLFSLNTKIHSSFLFGYKQGNTMNSESQTRKFNISLGIVPQFTYQKKKKPVFFLSPYYEKSLIIHPAFPYSDSQKTGIVAGLYFNMGNK